MTGEQQSRPQCHAEYGGHYQESGLILLQSRSVVKSSQSSCALMHNRQTSFMRAYQLPGGPLVGFAWTKDEQLSSYEKRGLLPATLCSNLETPFKNLLCSRIRLGSSYPANTLGNHGRALQPSHALKRVRSAITSYLAPEPSRFHRTADKYRSCSPSWKS